VRLTQLTYGKHRPTLLWYKIHPIRSKAII